MTNIIFTIPRGEHLSCELFKGSLKGKSILKLGCKIKTSKGQISKDIQRKHGRIHLLDFSNTDADIRFENLKDGRSYMKILPKTDMACYLSGTKRNLSTLSCNPVLIE